MGIRRDAGRRLLLLAAALGLLWTTLVAAGVESDTVADEPAAAVEPEAAPAEELQPMEGETAVAAAPVGDGSAPEPAPPAQTPPSEGVPAPDPPPAADDAPVADDAPTAEEAPPAGDAAPAEDAPAAEEPPAAEDAPANDEAPAAGATPAEDAPPSPPEPPPAAGAAAAERVAHFVSSPTTLTTRKSTDPTGASTSFPFTVTGPSISDSFSLADDGSHTSTLPGAGSFTLTETVPAGWQVVDIDCTNGSLKQTSGGAASITLTVAAGERWDCLVTDQQLATIVIVKSVDFDDDTSFPFTGDLGEFTIDPDGTTGSKTFTDVVPYRVYDVTETVPAGWDLTGISCSDKSSSTTNTITIDDPAPGSTTTCTFTNQAQAGTITVVKEADPADGTDFPFTIEAGRLPEPFTLDDDTDPTLPDRASFDRDPGTWTVTEAPPAGWEVAGIACDNGQSAAAGATSIDVALGAGGDVTCTFTNSKQRATIVIEKDVDFDDATIFSFGGDLGDFTIDPNGLTGSKTFTDLDPDADYTVTETVPAGWDFGGVLCSDKASSASPSITIDPVAGETTTCTFTNEAQQGTVTVVKVADPVDGTQFSFGGDLGDFTLIAESEPPPPDPGPPERAAPRSQHQQTFTVDPGSYDIVEDVPAGWLLRSAICTGDANGGGGRAAHTGVTAAVRPGEDVTCTFGNVKLASLTIAKDAEPADGTRFPITVTEDAPGRPGGHVGAFELAHGEEEKLADLAPARYLIEEDLPNGWGLASVDCGAAAVVPGAAPGTAIVTVGGGDDVRCTLRNRQSAKITIAKAADFQDGTQFPFTGDLGDFFLTSTTGGDDGEARAAARQEEPPDLPPTGNGSLTFTVDPGTFVVTEEELPGWDLARIACQGGTTRVGDTAPGPRATVPPNSVEITVKAGDAVECTFRNTALPGSLTIRKEADPDDGTAFDFTFAPGEGEERFALRHGEERLFADLRPGTYRVVEAAPAGWGVREIDCGPAEAVIDTPAGTVDVTVGPGTDATCVFRNTDTATITIVKQATPADGTDFFFTGGLGDFALDVEDVPPPPPGDGEGDGGGPPPQPRQAGEEDLPDRLTFEVPAGSYDVMEEANDDWELVAIVCGPEPPPPSGPPPPDPRATTTVDLGKRTVTIDVAAGEELTCVFRNRARPVALTLVKRTAPASDIPFDINVLASDGTSATVTLRDGERQTIEVAVGETVLTEKLPAGWGLREASCDSPASVDHRLASVEVTMRPGTPQTCELVNARTALVTIRKLAAPLVDTEFTFGGDQGPFTLTVPAPPTPPPPGDGGPEVQGSSLGPAPRQAPEEGEPRPDEITFEVDPGTYAFTERATPGWELVAIACSGIPTHPRPDTPTPRADGTSGAVTDLAARTATLTVHSGDVVECRFENRQTRRGLTIVKRAVPPDGTDFAFALDDSGGIRSPVAFTLADGGAEAFEVAGKVRVTEESTPGWVLVSLDCDVPDALVSLEGHVPDPGTGEAAGWVEIELPAGAAATCVFTNHRRGAVTVLKRATPADGTDFPFTLEGPGGVEELTLDDGADGDEFGDRVTVSGLVPGGYSLTELVPAGWALRDVSCAGAEAFAGSGPTVEFELAPGGHVVCTFDDVKLASLEGELFLDLNGDGERNPGEPDLAGIEVRSLWAGFDGEFGTGDDEEFSTRSVAGNSYRFDGLPPGMHRVTVVDPDRLDPTRPLSFEIELAPGEAARGPVFAFAGADLELSVASSTDAPRATVPFQVTIAVFNRGPRDPTGVTARVEVSDGLRVGQAAGDGAFDAAAGRWDIGEIPSGSTKTLVLTVTPLRAGDTVRLEAEVSASSLDDPDSTPNNDDPAEDDQDATRSFTVGVAPAELLPVTGVEAEGLVPPALVFLFGGLVLVLAGRNGRRRRDAPVSGSRHPTPGR